MRNALIYKQFIGRRPDWRLAVIHQPGRTHAALTSLNPLQYFPAFLSAASIVASGSSRDNGAAQEFVQCFLAAIERFPIMFLADRLFVPCR
jgi:hypothetical protein